MNLTHFRAGAWLAVVFLSACAASRAPTNEPVRTPEPAPTCNAAPARAAIGQVATARVVEQSRQQSGARLARVLRPGQAVTMEFAGDRLNIDVDATGVVTRVRCG